MPLIIFENNRGGVEPLSPQRIRNDLLNLTNTEISEVREFSFDETSSAVLSSITGKLGLSQSRVSLDDIRDAVADLVDGDSVSAIFSFSRQHFMAVAYLIYTGGVDAAGISRLISLDYRTRTEALLQLIPEPETQAESNLVLEGFLRESSGLFSAPGQRGFRPVDFGFFSPTGGGSTTIDVGRQIVPDIFFAIYYAYWFKIYNKQSPSDWPITRVQTDWVCGGSRCNNTSARNNWLETDVYSKWSSNFEGLRDTFPTFANLLETRSDYQENSKSISSEVTHAFLVNSFLPMSAARTFYKRMSNKASEWSGFPLENWSAEATRRGVWQGSRVYEPYTPNYFLFARWMHDNTDSVATSDRGLTYWRDFLDNGSNALRATATSYQSASSDFSYISDSDLPRVKEFMQELFPVNSSSADRSFPGYMAGHLLNRRVITSVPAPGGTSRYATTLNSLASTSITVRSRMSQLSRFDLLAKDDGTLLSLGDQGVKDFALRAIESALAAAGYTDDDILNLDTESAAIARLTELKSAVTSWILAQSPDASSQFYNALLNDSNANELNRIFVAGVAGQYFDYLLDPDQTAFSPSLGSGLMKGYRLLNFLKHTFINFDSYLSAITGSQYYRQFVLMVLLAYSGVSDRQAIYSLVTSREITAEDLSNQFDQAPATRFVGLVQENNSGSGAGGSFGGGGGGSTGGGGSGTRTR